MVQRIAVVGNSGAGKTTLSLKLAQLHALPLTHVDDIQFAPGMKIKPYQESIAILTQIQTQATWIIDGYGPLDIIEKRFELADRVIFIDFPLWRHLWWASKRQIKNFILRNDRASFEHTVKLYKTMWGVHKKMRPELLRIFSRDYLKSKVIHVQNLKQWQALFKDGARS